MILVQSGFGNSLLYVVKGGVVRHLQALPVAGGVLADTIRFVFIYDSVAVGDPELAIRITNNGPVEPHSFDLVLSCLSASAKFNLALVFANGTTGLSNVTVFGDILRRLTSAELNFFALPVGTRSGVYLPMDLITGVAVSGTLPVGAINVGGVEGVAFAVLTNANGAPINPAL